MSSSLPESGEKRGGWGLLLLLCLIWGQLFLALLPTWLEIPNYRYALVAAPFWCYFMVQAWNDVPRDAFARSTEKKRETLLWMAFLALLPVLFLRSLEQVDQFWRLPLWLHGASVIAATQLLFCWTFGWRKSLGLMRLSLLALVLFPLPSVIEGFVSGRLTDIVINGVSGLLPLMSYPIDRLGNSMLVKGEILDVSEGCSGLRSFQASVMIGLYLGEFYQHSTVRRIILLALAFGLAMVGNGARILYLTIVAYQEGPEAEARIHDAAGIVAVTFIYGSIGLVAWSLSRKKVAWTTRVMRKEKQS